MSEYDIREGRMTWASGDAEHKNAWVELKHVGDGVWMHIPAIRPVLMTPDEARRLARQLRHLANRAEIAADIR